MTTTALDLFRSVRKEDFPDGVVIEGNAAPGVLFPDFHEKALANGRIRRPDVELLTGDDGHEWVRSGGGTSLFDVRGVFKGRNWLNFTIPSGTEIPGSLIVRKTHYSHDYGATHYQIESKAKLMRIDAFQGALDNLARNAIVRSIEAAEKSTAD